MSASVSPLDVEAFGPSTSSAPRRRVAYDKPEPCYCKIGSTTGLIALSLTSFKTLHEKKPLKEQLTILHRLHLQLDAVAVKFSGSSESYLVAKTCDSAVEAALSIKDVATELSTIHKDIKGVVSFGEVGFALLGASAWNYQFYGELVTDLKTKAEELRPGDFIFLPPLQEILQSDEISAEEIAACPVLSELRQETRNIPESENSETQFRTWWASRVQYMDIWVLVLTFIFAAVSIGNQATQSAIHPEGSVLPFFLQVQCCIVNVFAAFGWAINRNWFLRNHSVVMSVVWCTQFFSRAVQAWTHIPYDPSVQALSILRQLLAMNGPEKLLLMTAPVNLRISGCLHWFGFVGSLGTVYRFCLGANGSFDTSKLPFSITTMFFISFFAFFILPLAYSARVEKEARGAFNRLNTKQKEKEN